MDQAEEIEKQQLTPKDLLKVKNYLLTQVTLRIEGQEDRTVTPPNKIIEYLEETYQEANIELRKELKAAVYRDVVHDIAGYGPIQPY